MVAVSVVVPIYNVEKYLSRCLDSIINQTFKDIEIICINDGSTDNSLNILTQYQKIDNRIIIINQENEKLTITRNRGIEKATGKYLMMVDSDDFISTIAIEKLYKKAEEYNAEVVLFDYAMDGKLGNKYYNIVASSIDKAFEKTTFNAKTIEPMAFMYTPVFEWAKLYRTEFIKANNIKFLEGRIYSSVDFYAHVYAQAERMIYMKEPFYCHITSRAESTSNSKKGSEVFDIFATYEGAINAFKKSGLYEEYKHVLQHMMSSDLLKKFILIKPELKELFYNKMKNETFKIDIPELRKTVCYPGEDTNLDIFEIFQQSADFLDFCKKIGANHEKKS